jgi:nucleoside-diphosphate-sugar epimerase
MDHSGRKRILITGATGTLGYNVYRELSGDARYELYLPVRVLRPELFKPDGQVRVFVLDLADRTRVSDIVEQLQPEVVVHCAASGLRPPKPAWFEMTSFNVEGTLRLFEACCALKHCHFIYISSGLVYREQGVCVVRNGAYGHTPSLRRKQGRRGVAVARRGRGIWAEADPVASVLLHRAQ